MGSFPFKLSNFKYFLDQIFAVVLCLASLTVNAIPAPQGFGNGGIARAVGDAFERGIERGVQNAAENILERNIGGSRGFGGRDYDSGFGSGGRDYNSDSGGFGNNGFDNNGYNSGGYNSGGIGSGLGILNPLGLGNF